MPPMVLFWLRLRLSSWLYSLTNKGLDSPCCHPKQLACRLLLGRGMYPQREENLEKKLTLIASEVESVRDALRGAILAIEVERAAIGKSQGDFENDLQAILGLGVLLGDLQERRVRMTKRSSQLPSPNQAPAELRDEVVTLGEKIFETVSHIKNIQAEIYRLACLNLRSASHKVKGAEMAPTAKRAARKSYAAV